MQHAFLSFPCRCFAQLQLCFVRLKRQTSLLHIIFMEELSYLLTQYFVSCVHVRFYFSLPLIFTLLAASISHFLTAALNFHVFLPTKFVSITRSSSFFVIHVSVNIKNNAEKDTTLLLFFLSFFSHFLSYGALPTRGAKRRAWSSAINFLNVGHLVLKALSPKKNALIFSEIVTVMINW